MVFTCFYDLPKQTNTNPILIKVNVCRNFASRFGFRKLWVEGGFTPTVEGCINPLPGFHPNNSGARLPNTGPPTPLNMFAAQHPFLSGHSCLQRRTLILQIPCLGQVWRMPVESLRSLLGVWGCSQASGTRSSFPIQHCQCFASLEDMESMFFQFFGGTCT